jgi:hypothetical protein
MKKLISILSIATLVLTITTSCEKECECKCPQTEEKTLTAQPGPDNGQDCLVAYRETDGGLYANSNLNSNPDMAASRWTYSSQGAGEGTVRTYFRFTQLSEVPQSAVIKSAKLSLYGLSSGVSSPEGNSVYPGSPYSSYGTNACWLKRATGTWDESTIKWNNKPSTTDVNQVEVPASTSQWNYNVTDLDVTQLVKDMVSNNQNYGFVLQLQYEQIYRSLNFASSEVADATKRPKLVVVYESN